MIPDFDANGNLPPGIHEADIDQVIARFSRPQSRKRTDRTRKLAVFYNFIHPYVDKFYVNGSYTTAKLSPDDVDIVLLLNKNFDFKSDAGQELERYSYQKHIYQLHIFMSITGHPSESDFTKWVEFFQTNTRVYPPVKKGIVSVNTKKD